MAARAVNGLGAPGCALASLNLTSHLAIRARTKADLSQSRLSADSRTFGDNFWLSSRLELTKRTCHRVGKARPVVPPIVDRHFAFS